MNEPLAYDALLIVSFGGPEQPADVIPFLENVLRGRNVPRERMLEVAEHYYHFGGVSPINAQNRELISALQDEFRRSGLSLPIYWGNRNWRPLLPDTLCQMAADGIQRALAYFTSAFSSYSGCRQYHENLIAARQDVGPGAPRIDKLRAFFNHPLFVDATVDRVREAWRRIADGERSEAAMVFTAHSIPSSQAATCRYVEQLQETARLVAAALEIEDWNLVYQSRSGPPTQPWLGPDILDHLRQLHAAGRRHVVVSPIGFLSDHMEVMYDLDTEAQTLCDDLGLKMHRAGTVGAHPAMIRMIRDLVLERCSSGTERVAIGRLPPSHDFCPDDCCPPPARPASR